MARLLAIASFTLFFSWNLCAQLQRHKDSLDIYYERSDYLKALKFSNKLYAEYQRAKDIRKMTRISVRQSQIHFVLGDSKKAMEVAYDALRLAEKEDDLYSQAIVLRQMGSILGNRVDFKTASGKLHKGLKIAQRIKNDSLQGDFIQAIFGLHFDKRSDSLGYYLKITNRFHKSLHTDLGNYVSNNNSFVYYMTKKDYASALKYVDSAIFFARRLSVKRQLFNALSNKAAIFYETKDFGKAKPLYDEMYGLYPGDTTSTIIGDSYYTYSGILAGLGDYKKAYEYTVKSIELQNDTYSHEVNSAVRDAGTRYELQKAEDRSNRERFIYLIVIAVFCISLILLYFFYQNNRLKQKNRLSEIESENQQKLLSATLDAREIERKHIASVLHDSVSAMLSSAGLQLTAFASGQPSDSAEIAKTRHILKEAHDKVRDLSHELVPTLLSKFGLAYALQDLCEKHSSKNIAFDYHDDASLTRYDEDFEMKIYFITSELLNNVLKHSQASKAKLELRSAGGMLHLILEDNGKGFDAAKPQSEGFGLTQIRARVTALKGKFNIISKPGTGTRTKINVPLPN